MEVENSDLFEEDESEEAEDEIWNGAIGSEEVPQQAIDYAEKNNLVKIIYSYCKYSLCLSIRLEY